MIKYILLSICLLGVVSLVQAQEENVRCKCVCPRVLINNGSTLSRKVFVQTFNEPGRCNCPNVVDKVVQETEYNFCNRCECQWQRRNTTTIKIVVILIICIVALLFLYMLFLLCLDPLMSRRPKTYFEQHNEEVNMSDQVGPASVDVPQDTQSVVPGGMLADDSVRPRGAIITRVRNEVSRVRGEQQKWKGTVQEQRKHIFDRHTMLN